MQICYRQEACEVDLSQVAACIFSCPQHRSEHRCCINVAFSTTSGKISLASQAAGQDARLSSAAGAAQSRQSATRLQVRSTAM